MTFYLKPGRKKIRFEIEVKKDGVKKFPHDFLTGQFERFEELLTEHFYDQATRLFDLENSTFKNSGRLKEFNSFLLFLYW